VTDDRRTTAMKTARPLHQYGRLKTPQRNRQMQIFRYNFRNKLKTAKYNKNFKNAGFLKTKCVSLFLDRLFTSSA